jgi:hypothetical protein
MLRRGTSTAYYGLFHCICLEASDHLLSGSSEQTRLAFARTFGHRQVRKGCDWIASGAGSPTSVERIVRYLRPTPIADVAAAFGDLQEARHDADYNHLAVLSKATAAAYVADAEAAIGALRSASRRQRAAFFVLLTLCATPRSFP